jgi:hypothetical protein
VNIQQELRDLAVKLDGGVGKPLFDYEGYRALVYQMSEGKTDEELEREIEGLRRMIPDRARKWER